MEIAVWLKRRLCSLCWNAESETYCGVRVGRLYRIIPACHRLQKRKLSVSEMLGAGLAGRSGCVQGRWQRMCLGWGGHRCYSWGFLDGQLEGDVHLSLLSQRDDFRKLYNLLADRERIKSSQLNMWTQNTQWPAPPGVNILLAQITRITTNRAVFKKYWWIF